MIEQIVRDNKTTIFELSHSNNLENGCFAWIPCMQMDDPHILEIQRNSTNLSTHDEIQWQITPVNKTHYKRNHTEQLPIKNLHLGKNQELLISPSKRRLCLIISKNNIKNLNLTNEEQLKYAQHLTLETFIAIPAYSCSTSIEPTSFGPEITDRIKNFIYPHLFYLPKYENTANNNQIASGLQKLSNAGSIFRLDEMFNFRNNESISKVNYKLTTVAQKILFIHIHCLFGNQEQFKQLQKRTK